MGFPVAQLVKNLPEIQETPVWFLGEGDPLEEGRATHSSILAWRIPMDRGAWQAAVLGVEKSWTGLSDAHTLGNSNSDGIDLWLFKILPSHNSFAQGKVNREVGGEKDLFVRSIEDGENNGARVKMEPGRRGWFILQMDPAEDKYMSLLGL